jgi:hypothetical protein
MVYVLSIAVCDFCASLVSQVRAVHLRSRVLTGSATATLRSKYNHTHPRWLVNRTTRFH